MFNEKKISENRVCYNEGKVDMLRDILFKMELKGRKTIKFKELEELFTEKQKMYEMSWNMWADQNKIGGTRYTLEGKGEAI